MKVTKLGNGRFLVNRLAACLSAVVLLATQTNAATADDAATDKQGGFFGSDFAISPLAPRQELGAAPQMEFLTGAPREVVFDHAAEDREEAKREAEAARMRAAASGMAVPASGEAGFDPAASPGSNSEFATAPSDQNLTASQKILKKYGDPSKDAPIKPTENAPTPFSGMMDALESGDEDLAFQYARQYVRHLQNLKKRTSRVLSMTRYAMKREGIVEDKAWKGAPDSVEDRILFEKDLERELAAKAGVEEDESADSLPGDLESKARDIFSRAAGGVAADSADQEVAENNDQRELKKRSEQRLLRKAVREQLAGELPVDPQGKIAAYLFINPADPRSYQMASEFEKAYRQMSGDSRVNFAGFTLSKVEPDKITELRRQVQATFPIVSGARLASELKIRQAPAVVLVAAGSGQHHVELNSRVAVEIEEMIRIMQGAK